MYKKYLFLPTFSIFFVDDFNSRLNNMELGYMEVQDKPTPIASTTLMSSGHSLKQSGWL